ncbi:CBL-interacting protein kinase 5 [Phytophthora nicotianae]|uniref:CBL-interacting protein kinase 5 n=1 Tax=Phytophthora nicotianae TaxID=4792 RepID=A0A0W8DLW2_PHYNI|nr:CBL-interacting protein kinase 5 [Phytophthora nicotianae]
MVVWSSTRVQEEGKEAAVAVPSEVAEAIAMVQSDSPLVAAEGFSKLSHATFNNPVGKEAAGEAGAIKAIVDAMERNISNGTVQEDGCHALRNVAFHCLPNLVLAREQGAIAAVLKAMETHPENEALQAEGLWALLVFCSNTVENVVIIVESAHFRNAFTLKKRCLGFIMDHFAHVIASKVL